MPKKVSVLYTPFDGKPKIYDNITTACDDLGLNYRTIVVKFQRQEKKGESPIHLWVDGKLELADE